MSDTEDGEPKNGEPKDIASQNANVDDSELTESELAAWGMGANAASAAQSTAIPGAVPGASGSGAGSGSGDQPRDPVPEALLDIELEATLRFGSREMTLGEVLDLGPGDVIELDRQVNDAVDLLVGDKIVARGHAVLSNGKYGIRVSEVAELKWSLESVRCLF